MRYLIQFADKTTKRVKQWEALALMKAIHERRPAFLRGALIDPFFVKKIQPINKEWFDSDFVQKNIPTEEEKMENLLMLKKHNLFDMLPTLTKVSNTLELAQKVAQ